MQSYEWLSRLIYFMGHFANYVVKIDFCWLGENKIKSIWVLFSQSLKLLFINNKLTE